MRLLSRYLLREQAKILIWILFVLALLCFVFDFFDRWDDLLEHRVPTRIGLAYMAFRLPQFFPYILPVSVLLSTFITLGLLGRTNQLTAIKASGISGYTIARPLLGLALLLSVASFFWAETVVPAANRKASLMWQVEVEKVPLRSLFRKNEVWLRSPSKTGVTIYHIGFLKIRKAKLPGPSLEGGMTRPPKLKNVSVLRLNKSFDLVERIDAREMAWERDRWVFLKGIHWGPDASGRYRTRTFDRETFPLEENPEAFHLVERTAEEMGFFTLLSYIQRARKEGYDTTGYLTDLHFKVSASLFSLIMVLFTVPLALRIPPKATGLALGVAVCMAYSFLYYLVMAVGLALGHAGALPAFVGAWGGNLIFGGIGLWWMLHLKH